MRASLADSLGRYGASGEWDSSASPSSSFDGQSSGGSTGAGEQPSWTQGILER